MSSSADPPPQRPRPDPSRRRWVREEIEARLEQSPTIFNVGLTPADVERMTAAMASARSLAPPDVDEMMLQALADGLFFREQQQRGARVLLQHPDGHLEEVELR